jgi:serine/threonine-protein kinase
LVISSDDSSGLQGPVLSPGDVIGEHYEIEEQIGQGGMATVYRALERKHKRRVAIKVLRSEVGDSIGLERFSREIEIISKLQHPNILPLYDSGEWKNRLYYVMPFVEGESLRDRLTREPKLPINEVVELAQRTALALDYAHTRGIVHRDIKPENIMLTGGSVVVADFGIARALTAGATKLTQSGFAIGTPEYMSPEQAESTSDIHGSTDQYSLGCVVYEALTGEAPFSGSSAQQVIIRHWRDPVPEITRKRPDVPAAVEDAICKALEKDPKKRFATVSEFASALSVGATQSRMLPALNNKSRRLFAWAAAASALVLLAAWAVPAFISRAGTNPSSDAAAVRPLLIVLPFVHSGNAADKYIADGVTDEVTSRLSSIRGLRMISRGTANQYANTPLAQIGKDLKARYVLTGSIATDRTADGVVKMRVIPRLFDLKDGGETEIWSEPSQQDVLPGKVFDVQAKVANGVAHALSVRLAPDEEHAVSAPVTANAEAYGYFLRAAPYSSFLFDERPTRLAVELYESATKADTTFALAYAKLAQFQTLYYYFFDRTPKRLLAAKLAADRAMALDPQLPEARIALGYYYYLGALDYDRAMQQFQSAQKDQPSNTELAWIMASVTRRMGKWAEAEKLFRRAVELDPRSKLLSIELGTTLLHTRQYAEADKEFQRCIGLDVQYYGCYFQSAEIPMLWKGDLVARRKRLTEAAAHSDGGAVIESLLLVDGGGEGRWALMISGPEFQSKLERMSLGAVRVDSSAYYLALADWKRTQGKMPEAKKAADAARKILEKRLKDRPEDAVLHGSLGVAYAYLGRKDDAIREATTGTRLDPIAQDALRGPLYERTLLEVHLLLGNVDEAVDLIRHQLSVPTNLSVESIKVDPHFDGIRSDPKFQALLRPASAQQ